MEKAIAPMISFVLVVLIAVVAISIVLSTGLDPLDSYRDSVLINEGERNLETIDNAITQASQEGVGVLKVVEMNVNGGTYRLDDSSNSITFETNLRKDFLEHGNFTYGKKTRNVTHGKIKISRTYQKIILEGELLAQNGFHEICVRKTGETNSTSTVRVEIC